MGNIIHYCIKYFRNFTVKVVKQVIMKHLLFILLISTLSATSLYSQTEFAKDSIPPLEKKELIKLNEGKNDYLNRDIHGNEIKKDLTNYRTDSLKARPMPQVTELIPYDFNFEFSPIDLYGGPAQSPSPIINNPYINDYAFRTGQILSDKLWLSSLSVQNTYPTIGANRSINLNVNYQPTDWLIVSGGAYVAKYNHIYGGSAMRRNFNDVGINSNLKFILHDRIRLNAFGQYSVYGDKNNIGGPMMHMYPHTYYGGSIEVKITEKFGIEGGVIRELNPFNGKWENKPFIAPVFYGN